MAHLRSESGRKRGQVNRKDAKIAKEAQRVMELKHGAQGWTLVPSFQFLVSSFQFLDPATLTPNPFPLTPYLHFQTDSGACT